MTREDTNRQVTFSAAEVEGMWEQLLEAMEDLSLLRHVLASPSMNHLDTAHAHVDQYAVVRFVERQIDLARDKIHEVADEQLMRRSNEAERATERCGELLKQIEPKPGSRTDREPSKGDRTRSRKDAARSAGLSKHQQDQAIRVASVPADELEKRDDRDRPASEVQQELADALEDLAAVSEAARKGASKMIPRISMSVSKVVELRDQLESWHGAEYTPFPCVWGEALANELALVKQRAADGEHYEDAFSAISLMVDNLSKQATAAVLEQRANDQG